MIVSNVLEDLYSNIVRWCIPITLLLCCMGLCTAAGRRDRHHPCISCSWESRCLVQGSLALIVPVIPSHQDKNDDGYVREMYGSE
ncbi:hypothetical protein F4859DRAFT_388937 [Xylaria cf. heliscus]|nr:hypothetical protein F4859DRAFT_388937 [Xylaria cf. heliscus]